MSPSGAQALTTQPVYYIIIVWPEATILPTDPDLLVNIRVRACLRESAVVAATTIDKVFHITRTFFIENLDDAGKPRTFIYLDVDLSAGGGLPPQEEKPVEPEPDPETEPVIERTHFRKPKAVEKDEAKRRRRDNE
ncbi:hypothetical protein MUP59_09875 [Candidatus Bathyarchaeota archaeon]|nr:hypothetical protein [Candidatus Bathyarchaeota archaeon]